MAFFFFDYTQMAATLDKEVRNAIQDINRDYNTSLTQDRSVGSSMNKFVPDYLIRKDGESFLIIEYKSQLGYIRNTD